MLKMKTVHGVLWSFIEQLLRRGVSFLVTLLLARFLVPEDFGLLAMMAVFIAITNSLMDSGIKQALIRKKDASQVAFNTAFYTNLVFGIFAYALLFGVAPWVAEFYEEPHLTLLIRVLGVVVLINSFQLIQSAILSKELNFKTQLKASVPASVLSGILAIILAQQGAGVWALIAQMVVSSLLLSIILWYVQRWRPTLSYDFSIFKEMYLFGYKLFLANLLNIIVKNLYIIVIAKVFSAGAAGLYFFANRIKELVVEQLVTAVQKVTYPALSTMQDDDVRLKAAYRKVLKLTTFILFPTLLMIAVLAEPIFLVLFSERWLPAVIYLQLMCIAALLYPLHSINLNILKVKGRTDVYLGISVFKKIVICAVLFVTYRYGIVAILCGQIAQSIFSYIPNGYYSSQLIKYRMKEQVLDILPGLLLSLAVCLVVYSLSQLLTLEPVWKLLMLGSTGSLTYILFAKLLNFEAYNMAEELFLQKFSTTKVYKRFMRRYG
ncbi:lipopolysaccharide biosynthesis protein [Vreelandella sp. H-I2]